MVLGGVSLDDADPPGISALELQRKLGLARYETAFQLLDKLRTAMERPDRDPIGASWPIEMDITLVGGRNKGGGNRKTTKVAVVIAVEVRRKELRNPQTGELVNHAVAGRVRLRLLPNKTATAIDRFASDCIAPGACVATDDGGEFQNLRQGGFRHQPLPCAAVARGWMLGCRCTLHVAVNLKAWLVGTFHGVGEQHLQNVPGRVRVSLQPPLPSSRVLQNLARPREKPHRSDVPGPLCPRPDSVAKTSTDGKSVLTG